MVAFKKWGGGGILKWGLIPPTDYDVPITTGNKPHALTIN